MAIMGVRCSNKDFSYAVLDGAVDAPILVAAETLVVPPGYASSQALHWLQQEVTTLIRRHGIAKIVIKQCEGGSQGKAYETRVENEGAIKAAAGALGLKAVYKKRKVTLAKNLCGKGRARYLDTLDTSVIEGFASKPSKLQEALLCGWSELTGAHVK